MTSPSRDCDTTIRSVADGQFLSIGARVTAENGDVYALPVLAEKSIEFQYYADNGDDRVVACSITRVVQPYYWIAAPTLRGNLSLIWTSSEMPKNNLVFIREG